MLIVDFDGLPFWYLDVSETGESTECPWVGVVQGTGSGKKRETVTASLFLVFKGCGRFLTPPLIISIKNVLPWTKKPVKSGKHDIDYVLLCSCEVIIAHEIDSMQFTKLSQMNADERTLL